MWTWLASLIGGPIISGAINAYKAKLEAGNTRERIAAEMVERELAVQQQEIQAQNQLKIAEIGHPFEVEKLFAYVLLIYFAKVYLWDAAFGWGSTDAVRGAVGDWAGLIVMFYFGKRGAENIARILKR